MSEKRSDVCTCGHPRDIHGRRDAQTGWQAHCYGDADCDCDDFSSFPSSVFVFTQWEGQR